MLEACWGLFLGIRRRAFLVIALRPRTALAATAELVTAVATLAVAALASLEWVDHYSVQAAVALLMVVLAFLTAL
jgi:hypothetical protein